MDIENLIELARNFTITDEDIDALNIRLSDYDYKVDKPIDLDIIYTL